MPKLVNSLVAATLLLGATTFALAQNVGGGQTQTPQSAPNPDDPAMRNPQSPSSSNRGDPGSEAINPNTGGPAIGQGQQSPATTGQRPSDRQVVPPNAQPDDARVPVTPKGAETVGRGPQTVDPEGARNDPHTLGGKDEPIPDATRPTMPPTQGR